MKIFKGWYKKVSYKKNTVWHRICTVNSILDKEQFATTICNRKIPTTQSYFHDHPSNKCIKCDNPKDTTIEVMNKFVPIGALSIHTRQSAIAELKRLSKPRFYNIRIFENQGIILKAAWKSDFSVDIYYVDYIKITKRTKNVYTMDKVQEDLGRFKSSIDNLIKSADSLATIDKRKRGLKGRLTVIESHEYFDELLYEAEER